MAEGTEPCFRSAVLYAHLEGNRPCRYIMFSFTRKITSRRSVEHVAQVNEYIVASVLALQVRLKQGRLGSMGNLRYT